MGDRAGSTTAPPRSPARTTAPVGLVALLDGPAPSASALAARWSERLVGLPRFRQRPGGWDATSARSARTADADADLAHHLRRVHLPAPGSDEQFEALVGRIMSQRLRAGRPPWEAWTVEGVAHGRWALVVKVDRSLLDGGDAMTPVLAVLDRPDAGDLGHRTVAAPGWRRLVEAAAAGSRRAAARGTLVAEDTLRLAVGRRSATPSGPTRLSAPQATRRYRVTALELDDLDVVGGSWGCERDDVVRAVVARAWRHVQLAHGERLAAAAPPAVLGVPGLDALQHLLGRPLVALVPYGPAVAGSSVTVAVTHYRRRLHVGVTCDHTALADADAFVRALGAALHRFRRLAVSEATRGRPSPERVPDHAERPVPVGVGAPADRRPT